MTQLNPFPNMPKSVCVLYGGPSRERSISIQSGLAVADACRNNGFVTIAINVDMKVARLPLSDVYFSVIHGRYGEDGAVHRLFESNGLRFVGSGSAASAIGFDKHLAKLCWRRANLPTAPWYTVSEFGDFQAASKFAGDRCVVVKPRTNGSSIGAAIIEPQNINRALSNGLRRYGPMMIERRLCGPELTVGVLGNKALPVLEIKPNSLMFDYAAKYKRTDTIVDVRRDNVALEAQCIAISACRALGVTHLARVDLIADHLEGIQILEINTMPGFTRRSLLPHAANIEGISFDTLIKKLVVTSPTAGERHSSNKYGKLTSKSDEDARFLAPSL
jgi:D-alanine-D-alanine ligase